MDKGIPVGKALISED